MVTTHSRRTNACPDIHHRSFHTRMPSIFRKSFSAFSLFLALVAFALPRPSTAQVTQQDSLALVAFYNATDGANWTNNANWLSGPVSTWAGVTPVSGRVYSIVLHSNNVSGSLPTAMGDLTAMVSLGLSNNQLVGPIPTELGQLTALTTLDLSSNQLSGTIPTSVGQMISLASLFLGTNQLTGPIPAQMGLLTQLTELNLNNNQLTGMIPDGIWLIDGLASISVAGNMLEGTIWTNLGQRTFLRNIDLSNNQFSGDFPTDLGGLTSLENLLLAGNQFTGALTASIASLPNLFFVQIENNRFTDLPDLSGVQNLFSLGIQNNRLEFDDILPNAGRSYAIGFTYTPQDSVGITSRITTQVGEPLEITVQTGGTGNVYAWFKNGEVIAGKTGPTLSFEQAASGDAGIYRADISNPGAPALVLAGRSTTVTITDPQRAALVAFYDRMCGETWKNKDGWKTERPLSEWYGVNVDSQGHVTGLFLVDNFIYEFAISDGSCEAAEIVDGYGVFPAAFFSGLQHLEWLSLRGNFITGPMPEKLFYMPNLARLDMSVNYLQAPGYNFWGNFCNNDCEPSADGFGKIIRRIPGQFTYLVDFGGTDGPYTAPLVYFDFSYNYLTGGFPPPGFHPTPEHPDYAGLSYFNASGNLLAGSLTPFLQDASVINQVWVDTPQTCQEIYGDDFKCSAPDGYPRWVMNVSDNGRKPKKARQIPGLPGLHLLDPNPTRPSQTTSSTFSTAVSQTGTASGTQAIAGCEWGFSTCASPNPGKAGARVPNGRSASKSSSALTYAVLDISYNDTEGEIPASIGNIPFLKQLNMGRNKFSGTLPEEMGNLIYLDSLIISNNNFSGELPQSLTALPNLAFFDFGASGAVPPADPAFQQWLASVPSVVQVSIEEILLPTLGVALSPLFPNPFQDSSRFTLRIESAQRVQIILYNTLGQRVREVTDTFLSAGEDHEFRLDVNEIPAGMYFLSVQGETFRTSGRAVVVR